MGTYDILMLLVIFGAVAFGAWKGLAWQIASVASLVASYFVSLTFSAPLAPWFGDSAPWNRFLAMLVLYVGTSAVIWLAFGVLRKGISRVRLHEFDRQMGALLGGVKGVLLCVAITFFAVTLLEDPKRSEILSSRSGKTIAQMIEKADAVAPEELHDVIGPYLHKVNDSFGNESHDLLPGTAGGFQFGNQQSQQPGYYLEQPPLQPAPPAGYNPSFNPGYQPGYPPVTQPVQPPSNPFPNWGQ